MKIFNDFTNYVLEFFQLDFSHEHVSLKYKSLFFYK